MSASRIAFRRLRGLGALVEGSSPGYSLVELLAYSAVLVTTAAFVLANHFDFPPAQMAVALLGLLLVAVWMSAAVRRAL